MVTTDVNTVTYNGDGSTTAFPFTFKIQDASEINLQLVYADGTVTEITSDFYVDTVTSTVHYPGYAPGSEPAEANQPAPVQTGQKLTIWRDVPMTQENDLGDKWPFHEIEDGLDKLTMICQQIYAFTNRKLDAALASMGLLADVVVDSDELQHITDQLNAIDDSAEAAADSAEAAADSAAAAATSATNAASSDASATATAAALTAYLDGKETLTAPAVDATLTISGAAADAQVTGEARQLLYDTTQRNIYTTEGITTGKRIDEEGNILNSVGGAYTANLPVEPNTLYTIKAVNASVNKTLRVLSYNSTDVFIKQELALTIEGSATVSGSFVTDENASFVKISSTNYSTISSILLLANIYNKETSVDVVARGDVQDFMDICGCNYLKAEIGNFRASDLSDELTADSVARSELLTNVEPCVIESTDSTATVTVFYGDTVTDAQYIRSQGEPIFLYNSNNYVRIRIQTLESYEPIYLEKLIVQKPLKKSLGKVLYLSDQYYDISGTYTEDVTIQVPKGLNKEQNQIVTCRATYSQSIGVSDVPTIQFKFANHYTSAYTIGSPNGYITQQWRVPPIIWNDFNIVQINVPEGVTLTIEYIRNNYDNAIYPSPYIKLNAHHGFERMCPQGTQPAVEMAARLGYPTCVVTPKLTSDGVLVCFHDDATIRGHLRYPNGDEIEEGSADDKPISQFTYEELLAFDFDSFYYQHTKILKLWDFFLICAKTGMTPMLSVHPNLSTDGWTSVKTMCDKLHITNKLAIKGGLLNILSSAYSVFGDTIESYTYDVSSDTATSHADNFGAAAMGVFLSTCPVAKGRVVVEYFSSVATEGRISAVLSAGYECAVAESGSLSGQDFENFINLGVYEFTDSYNPSNGLCW